MLGVPWTTSWNYITRVWKAVILKAEISVWVSYLLFFKESSVWNNHVTVKWYLLTYKWNSCKLVHIHSTNSFVCKRSFYGNVNISSSFLSKISELLANWGARSSMKRLRPSAWESRRTRSTGLFTKPPSTGSATRRRSTITRWTTYRTCHCWFVMSLSLFWKL